MKLPASLLPLRKSRGLHWVSGRYDTLSSWVKQENGAQEVFSELEAGNVPEQTYYLEGSRIILPKVKHSQCGIAAKVKIVCGMDGYGKDEQIKIPTQPMKFIEMVSKLMDEMRQIPQKTANDGNPNTA
jgi:hypothetical protein